MAKLWLRWSQHSVLMLVAKGFLYGLVDFWPWVHRVSFSLFSRAGPILWWLLRTTCLSLCLDFSPESGTIVAFLDLNSQWSVPLGCYPNWDWSDCGILGSTPASLSMFFVPGFWGGSTMWCPSGGTKRPDKVTGMTGWEWAGHGGMGCGGRLLLSISSGILRSPGVSISSPSTSSSVQIVSSWEGTSLGLELEAMVGFVKTST